MDYAPIVLFVYNRPDHTRKTVESLLANAEARDSVLYIFADGPKPNVDSDSLARILAVREYIHQIKGFKEVIIEEQSQNKSLAVSTIYGMSKVFSQYDKVIMMEDDDVAMPYFLKYVNECLTKYADDDRIWCVSGYTDTDLVPPRGEDDLFLVRRPSSWGFGTWKRCWEKVIWDKDVLRGLFKHLGLIYGYNKWCGMDSSLGIINCIKDRTSSWSIRYNLSCYLTRSYTILPTRSLILNIGLDGTGTHSPSMDQNLKTFERPVTIPSTIHFDKVRNKQLMMSYVPKKWLGRLFYHLGILTMYYFFTGRYKS